MTAFDACAFRAWRPGLELLLGKAGHDAWMTEEMRELTANHVLEGSQETMPHLACRADRPEEGILVVVKLLLSKGASPDMFDAQGLAPFDVSQEQGHKQVAKAFL